MYEGLWPCYYQVIKMKSVTCVFACVYLCTRCVVNTSEVTAHVARMTVALPTLQTARWLTPTTTQSQCVWTTLRAAVWGRSANTFTLQRTCRLKSKPPSTKSTRLQLLQLWYVLVHRLQQEEGLNIMCCYVPTNLVQPGALLSIRPTSNKTTLVWIEDKPNFSGAKIKSLIPSNVHLNLL